MAGNNQSQDQTLHDQQADAFLTAIHAPIEQKARILQAHPEIMNVVDYYEINVRTHTADNQGFQAALKSGNYEKMLADDIRHGSLDMFKPPASQVPESHVAVAGKQYDAQTRMLNGFDIQVEGRDKPLHVDVSHYSPKGKTEEETRQLREDIYSMYDFGIKRNPETAEKYLQKVAEKFPEGVTWHESGERSSPEGKTLRINGSPDLHVITTQKSGEHFFELHAEASIVPPKLQVSELDHNSLQGASAAINHGEHFTDTQKSRLNSMLAESLTKQGFSVAETTTLDHQQEFGAQRA